jgi:PTH1 family peptidyl-tRNA hydrolase
MIAQGDNLLLAKPQLFMNESGLAAAKLLSYFKLALPGAANPDTLIVFHDDLDIELGSYRLKAGSGSAGHKGVESIFAHLGTKDFTRLRIGIKTPELKHIPSEKFVLQRFPQDELAALNGAIQESLDQLLC